MKANLRIAALLADAGLQDRPMKATPALKAPQVTVVGASWNFSIAHSETISGPQNPVSKRERQPSTDEWSSYRHASQARAAIGAAGKSMRNRTPANVLKSLIILLIEAQNIDLLLTATYHPPTFAHARVNPNAARKG